MKYGKSFLRNQISRTKKERNTLKLKKFDFNLIFGLIKKHFRGKKNNYCWVLSI